jgi:hypothetical protein
MILLLPFPLSPVSKLDRRHTGRLRKRDNLLTGEGEGGGGEEANSCDKEENGPLLIIQYLLGSPIHQRW